MVPPRMPHRAPNSDPNKTGIKRGTYKDNNGATSPECQENKGLFSVGEKNGKKLMKINWRKEREGDRVCCDTVKEKRLNF